MENLSETVNPFESTREKLRGGNGWCKKSLATDTPAGRQYCLLGASHYRGNQIALMHKVIEEQFRDRQDGRICSILYFNDHKDTTWEDIELVIDKAEILWFEQQELQQLTDPAEK